MNTDHSPEKVAVELYRGLCGGSVSAATALRVGLLHDQVTVSVTRPDWPVWS